MSLPFKFLQVTESALISGPPAFPSTRVRQYFVMPRADQSQICAWQWPLINQSYTVVCESLGCIILPEAGAGVHTLRSSQHSNAVIQLTTIF